MPNLTTSSTPLSPAPASPAPLFQRAQRYEVFRFVKPSHGLTLRGMAKLPTFWHLRAPTLKDPFRPQGNAKVRNFSLCQAPLSILHLLLDRAGKGTNFLTFTSTAPPCHRLAISQRSCQTAQPALPRSHPPFCFTRPPFSGSAKIRSFSLCQALLQPYPERDDKVTDFLAVTSPYSQRPLSPSRERKGTEFFALSSSPLSASLFIRERKGTKIPIWSRLLTFCCPARRLSKTLLILRRGQRYGIFGSVKPPL